MDYTVRCLIGTLPMHDQFALHDLPPAFVQAKSPLHAALKAAAVKVKARNEASQLTGFGKKGDDTPFTLHAFVFFEELGRHANGRPKKTLYFALDISTGLEAFLAQPVAIDVK